MHTVPVLNFRDFIAADGDTLTTTSQQVAAVFGKRHDRVLNAIRGLLRNLPEDRLPYFRETVERRLNPSGGSAISAPSYLVTRDGFTLLAMGFTGKKALTFKLAYIDAFNAMAAYIKNEREGLTYRYLTKLSEHKQDKAKVSGCAREMRVWQDVKPHQETELEAMAREMNPQLPFSTH